MDRVTGFSNLIKDRATNAVINTDRDGLIAAKAAKKRVMDSKQQQRQMESRILQLEQTVNHLLRIIGETPTKHD